MIKNKIAIASICLVLGACNSKAYNGFVYDQKSKKPIENVEVNDFLNQKSTKTDAKGYFNLEHEGKVSGKLIFKKQGYVSDTLPTISIQSGEKQVEKFKGDTIYLFGIHNNFRDSIAKLNEVKK